MPFLGLALRNSSVALGPTLTVPTGANLALAVILLILTWAVFTPAMGAAAERTGEAAIAGATIPTRSAADAKPATRNRSSLRPARPRGR